MKREILFRGKNAHGDWLFGDLTGRDTIHYDTSFCDGDGNCQWWGSKVDPETVGQFTGLTDKNGKKIFEGDIMKAYPIIAADRVEDTSFYVAVKWSECCFVANGLLGKRQAEISEVVGNIHENPELL